MPLRRGEAIVLRTYPVGEADKVVVFFCRDLGKLRGLAKGARRPRSRFGGSLEVGTEVSLTFFEKEGQELVSVDRCDIVRSEFPRLGEPVLACTLAYLADLVDAFMPEREPNEKVYRLVSASVASLAEGNEPEAVARYFEAWLLRLGGFYPRATTCAVCGSLLGREGVRYVVEEHRLACPRCSPSGVMLSPETWAYLHRVWHERPAEISKPDAANVMGELAELHQKLIREQMDGELVSYQVLQDLVRAERRQ